MSEIINLRKRLSTQFVWNGFSEILYNIIKEASETGNTIDVAGCRFGPDCGLQIDSANKSGRVNIINSEEPFLQNLLEQNKMAEAIRTGKLPVSGERRLLWMDFEKDTDRTLANLIKEIRESDKSVIWYANPGQKMYDENIGPVMAVLNMYFNKRKFDMSQNGILMQVFNIYRSVLTLNDYMNVNDYWYIIGNGYAVKASVNERGEVHLPAIGTYTKDAFINKIGVIPYWIGTESIIHDDRRLEIRNNLRDMIRDVVIVGRKEQSRTIAGLIKQYGDVTDYE